MNDEQWQVITGDCLEVMRGMDAGSVDAVITDPPYGLSFMGKEWDHGVPGVHFWQEALRVAKPGAMMLAFGGTRTFHRLAVAIEDAGWELRDTIMWLYGSGFPKSHDISKAIDKAAGKEREVVGTNGNGRPNRVGKYSNALAQAQTIGGVVTAPATDAARQWHGWGTALKPAWEPILVAMKPLNGTYANNALTHGVAGFWIDGNRIGTEQVETHARRNGTGTSLEWNKFTSGPDWKPEPHDPGRWPANVIHDGSDEVLAGFPVTTTGKYNGASNGLTSVTNYGHKSRPPHEASTGSAARFFYCAKSSRAERDAGLEGMTKARQGNRPGSPDPTGKFPDHDQREKGGNNHPTVKPLALMRYLARLTKTPTGGVVLDPFAGSGSTGCAAVMEGRGFIGIEIDEDYADIARARIAKAAEQARQLTLGIEQAA
jgi:DNA modification methylase